MSISLKAARVNAGMTLCDAAKALGLKDSGTLSSWEKGKTFPNVPQIKRIEEVYGLSYSQINFLPDSSV